MARGRKTRKPPAPENMEAKVPKKLSKSQVDERRERFVVKYGEKRALEKRKAAVTREINGDLKEVNAELDKLNEEILHETEMLAQGDLFSDEEGEPKAPQPVAMGTLAELEKRTQAKGGNGHADDLEAPPKIDQAAADDVRRAAKGERPKNWRGKRSESRP